MAESAGCSGTPLPKKLGIKEGSRVLVDHPPAGFLADVLVGLPSCILRQRAGAEPFDVLLAFRDRRSDFERNLDRDIARISRDGSLWIAWPKKASGVASDMSENVIREAALAAGLVDVKVCAIDQTWSGLKLVYRLADR